MSTPEEKSYKLTAYQSRRIFREEIVPDLFAGREPQQQPTAVVLLGQPGAGKTRVAEMVARSLDQRGGFADIDTDLYKPYHPDYQELMAKDDRLMTLHIGPEGREWMRQGQEYVRDKRINALVQDIANDPATSLQTVRDYRQAGFRVEIIAMGVHKTLSDQGILNRYHEQVKDRGQGRLTVPEKATAAYAGMLEYAATVDREGAAEFVAVYRRGESTPRYSNSLDERGQWAHTPGFRQALQATRDQPWSPAETRDFLRVQDKLRAEMPDDFRGQLDAISRDAAPLMHAETTEQHAVTRLASLAFPQAASRATENRSRGSAGNGRETSHQPGRERPETDRDRGAER